MECDQQYTYTVALSVSVYYRAERHASVDLRTHLIKVELEQCLNVYSTTSSSCGWISKKSNSEGDSATSTKQKKQSGLVSGKVASACDWFLGESNIQ